MAGLDGLISNLEEKVSVLEGTLNELQESQKKCDEIKALYPQLWEKYSKQITGLFELEFPDLYGLASGLLKGNLDALRDKKNLIKSYTARIKSLGETITTTQAEVQLCGLIMRAVEEAVQQSEVVNQGIDTARTAVSVVADELETSSSVLDTLSTDDDVLGEIEDIVSTEDI